MSEGTKVNLSIGKDSNMNAAQLFVFYTLCPLLILSGTLAVVATLATLTGMFLVALATAPAWLPLVYFVGWMSDR